MGRHHGVPVIRLLSLALAAALLLTAGLAYAVTPADDIGATVTLEDVRKNDYAGVSVLSAVAEERILRTPRTYPVIPSERTVIQQ